MRGRREPRLKHERKRPYIQGSRHRARRQRALAQQGQHRRHGR